MNSKNISKKNSIFSKLGFGSGFGWVQTIAVLVVMGMMLSCGSDDATTPDTNPDTTPDFFTISYPSIASESSNVSVPVIVNGKNCKLRTLTDAGSATYSVGLIPNAGLSSLELVIDSTTGVIKNRSGAGGVTESDPGSYRVAVKVTEKPECSANVIVYHTITPADKNALKSYFGGDNPNVIQKGDFNYIDTSKLTDFSSLFAYKTNFNGDISGWDTSQVINMSYMFLDTQVFNQPIGRWDTSKVQDMSSMFQAAQGFNQPIGGWNTAQVQDMSGMFSGTRFNQPLNEWNTSKVTNMSTMFGANPDFNRPLSNWNTAQVQDMSQMFFNATKFDQDLSGWTVTNVTKYDNVFFRSPMEKLTDKHPKWKQ